MLIEGVSLRAPKYTEHMKVHTCSCSASKQRKALHNLNKQVGAVIFLFHELFLQGHLFSDPKYLLLPWTSILSPLKRFSRRFYCYHPFQYWPRTCHDEAAATIPIPRKALGVRLFGPKDGIHCLLSVPVAEYVASRDGQGGHHPKSSSLDRKSSVRAALGKSPEVVSSAPL